MPVMTAWNIYASPRVLTEARVRIPAPARVQPCVRSLRGALRARRRVRGAALRPPPVRGRTEPRPFTNTITSCRRLSSARSPCRSRPRTRSPTTSLSRLAALPAGERADIVRLLVVAMIIDWRIPRAAQPGAGTTPDRGPPGSLHWGRQAPGGATFVAWPGPGRPRAPAPGLARPVSRSAPLTAPAGRPRWGPGGAPLPQAGRRAYMSWTSAAWKRATWCVGGSGSS